MKINFKKKKIAIPLIITLTIAIILLIFGITYFNYLDPSTAKYINTIKKASSDIKSINDDLRIITSASPIDSDLAKEKIPAATEKLLDVKSEVSAIEPIVKYENDTKALITGLDNNINFHKQAIMILQNPSATDLNLSLENLQKYKSLMLNNYEKINIKDIDFKLSNSTVTVFEYTIQYTKNLIDKNIALENDKTATAEYIDSIENIAGSFYNIKTNLSIDLDKSRSNNNYDDILQEISSKLSKLYSIKNQLSSIEPLEKGRTLYNDLYNALEYYNNYLSNFKDAVISEKSSAASGKKSIDELDSFYKDAKEAYTKTTNSISKYNDDLLLLKKS